MRKRVVITEAEVLRAWRAGQSTIEAPGAIVTPLARDAALEKGISIAADGDTSSSAPSASGRPRSDPGPARSVSGERIAVGSDHGGFKLKSALIPWLESRGWTVADVGTDSEESCDYPDFAYAVARTVESGRARFGLMIDGAGPGSTVVCNKVPGIRAAAATNEFLARNARAHNDCNVLVLGARVTSVEASRRIVRAFLATDFEGGRHARRVEKIHDLERRFSPDRSRG